MAWTTADLLTIKCNTFGLFISGVKYQQRSDPDSFCLLTLTLLNAFVFMGWKMVMLSIPVTNAIPDLKVN